VPGFSINYNENFGDRMVILYDSLTGNVARFVKKLPLETRKITEGLVMEEAFVLITFTTGLGKVPDTTASFLEVNHKHLKGVASSGNKNFGCITQWQQMKFVKRTTSPSFRNSNFLGHRRM